MRTTEIRENKTIMKFVLKMMIPILALLLVSSCRTYQPLELEPVALYAEVERSRNVSLPLESTLTFSEAAKRMEESSPMLAVVRKEYEGWQRVAGLKTPLPNPSLSAGPSFGSNLEGGASNSVQPFVSLGFSIPLGPRLIRNDELNAVREAKAYNETVARHRELFFRLRQAYFQYSIADRRIRAYQGVSRSIGDTRKSTKRLVELGSISPMGLTEVDLQAGQVDLARIGVEMDRDAAASALARLIGVKKSEVLRLSPTEVPTQVGLPDLSELRKSLLENNTELSRIQMRFKVRDAALRLELAEQYPDLSVGVDVDDEVGESVRTLSVPIGIELPLFDRNQRQIAMAENSRELEIMAYRSELSNLTAKLEEEHARLQLIERKLKLFDDQIIPAAKKNLAAGKRGVELGSIDVLRYLDLVSQLRGHEIARLDMEAERLDAISRIEELVGLPLVECK